MLSQLVKDAEEHGVVENLKSFNVRTVIYMVSESWDQLAKIILRKFWIKLWRSVPDSSDNKIEKEGETSEN